MAIIQPTRRNFLLGLLAAPVIVKVGALMPCKPIYATGGIVTGGPVPVMDTVYWWTVSGINQYGEPFVERLQVPDSLIETMEWRTSDARLAT